MQKKDRLSDYSEVDLRSLLAEKRRADRRQRLEHFRRTGRLVQTVSQAAPLTVDQWRSTTSDGPTRGGGPTRGRGEEERLIHLLSPPWGWRKVLDSLLLVLEVAALLVFILIVILAVSQLADNPQGDTQTSNFAQVGDPSLLQDRAALPAGNGLRPVVLPSGHTPPDAGGNFEFNEIDPQKKSKFSSSVGSETTLIPGQFYPPQVQGLPVAQVPPEILAPSESGASTAPAIEQAVRIQIPAIGLDAPIIQGDAWDDLKKGVGQHPGSGLPGQPGNLVLSAHNDIFGKIFRYLDKLQPGDEILISTEHNIYIYRVVQSRIVRPDRVDVMNSTKHPSVTLISCYPYRIDNRRIVVTADLESWSADLESKSEDLKNRLDSAVIGQD